MYSTNYPLIGVLHLLDQQRYIGGCYINDVGIIWQLTVHILHHLMGTVLGPIEHYSLVHAGAASNLIIRHIGPLRKLLA